MIVGSLVPINRLPSDAFFIGDKFLHLGGYAVVSIFAFFAHQRMKVQTKLLVLTFAVSVAIEFLQPYSGRSFELWDIFANVSGVVLAVFLCQYAISPIIEKYKLNNLIG